MPVAKPVNFTLTNNFSIVIPELPLTSHLTQDVTLPVMQLNEAFAPTRFVDVPQVGEKITWAELDIGFSVDENYDVYVEIYNWMKVMAGASEPDVSERRVAFCDTTVTMLSNSKKPIRRFTFTDCWPTTLGAIALDHGGQGEDVKGLLTLKFTLMNITPTTIDVENLVSPRHDYSNISID